VKTGRGHGVPHSRLGASALAASGAPARPGGRGRGLIVATGKRRCLSNRPCTRGNLKLARVASGWLGDGPVASESNTRATPLALSARARFPAQVALSDVRVGRSGCQWARFRISDLEPRARAGRPPAPGPLTRSGRRDGRVTGTGSSAGTRTRSLGPGAWFPGVQNKRASERGRSLEGANGGDWASPGKAAALRFPAPKVCFVPSQLGTGRRS
jgi:hypothetical protein